MDQVYLKPKDIADIYGISTTTVWRKMSEAKGFVGTRYPSWGYLPDVGQGGLWHKDVVADWMQYGRLLRYHAAGIPEWRQNSERGQG